MEPVGEPQGAGRRTPGALVPHWAAKSTRGRALSSGPTQKVEREGQGAAETPLSCGEDQRKLAEGDSSLLSGHPALIRTKPGRCGKVSNWNGAGPWGAFLGETPPHRKIP